MNCAMIATSSFIWFIRRLVEGHSVLCNICKLNSAVFDALDFAGGESSQEHLCHDCWKTLAELSRLKALYPGIDRGLMQTYAAQMTLVKKLTKKSFEEALDMRRVDPSVYIRMLCEISVRFVFEEMKKQYDENRTHIQTSTGQLIQECNMELMRQVESFTRKAQSYTVESYALWRKTLKNVVGDVMKKHAE